MMPQPLDKLLASWFRNQQVLKQNDINNKKKTMAKRKQTEERKYGSQRVSELAEGFT